MTNDKEIMNNKYKIGQVLYWIKDDEPYEPPSIKCGKVADVIDICKSKSNRIFLYTIECENIAYNPPYNKRYFKVLETSLYYNFDEISLKLEDLKNAYLQETTITKTNWEWRNKELIHLKWYKW